MTKNIQFLTNGNSAETQNKIQSDNTLICDSYVTVTSLAYANIHLHKHKGNAAYLLAQDYQHNINDWI